MNKQISFTEQLDFVMNVTSMLMNLVARAKELGINSEGKNRVELVKEIQQVENGAYLAAAN